MPRPTVDIHLNSKTIEHCRLGNSQWRHTGSRTRYIWSGLRVSAVLVAELSIVYWNWTRGILSQSMSNSSPSDKILHWLDCQLTLRRTCIRACRRFLIWCVRHCCWRYWNVYRIPWNMSNCLIHFVEPVSNSSTTLPQYINHSMSPTADFPIKFTAFHLPINPCHVLYRIFH